VRRARIQVAVGEIAAAAAGDADLLRDLVGMVDQQHLHAALAGEGGTQQAGGAGTDHEGIEFRHGAALSLPPGT